jgi:hypothetical protein
MSNSLLDCTKAPCVKKNWVTFTHYNWLKFQYLGGMYIYIMGNETNWTIMPIFSFSCLQFPIQEIEGVRN